MSAESGVDAEFWWRENELAWRECFEWYAVCRRIQRPLAALGLVFAGVCFARMFV